MTPVAVYLVPVGSTRYELYCESAEVDDLDPPDEHQRHQGIGLDPVFA